MRERSGNPFLARQERKCNPGVFDLTDDSAPAILRSRKIGPVFFQNQPAEIQVIHFIEDGLIAADQRGFGG
ncbi:hypothetical protein [Teichococcus rhizosphaerae]|uniref:hypothetical protein n=1 Tax=Teichococcus rhizosphaerae TaxID=1335062 RepID=UPI00159BB143|nr:hypothetical protein [Pseudoroseomonas rhizosphaerae]